MKLTYEKRIVTLLLIAAVCFAMLFSVSFIASESHHDCIGENCIICTQLSICENILRSLGCAAEVFMCVFAVAFLSRNRRETNICTLFYADPVSLKVELLN